MGWLRLRAWRREMVRSITRARGLEQTDPDTWTGQEADPWWEEQRRKNREQRGW